VNSTERILVSCWARDLETPSELWRLDRFSLRQGYPRQLHRQKMTMCLHQSALSQAQEQPEISDAVLSISRVDERVVVLVC
jgi:hypothetical protein